MYKLGVAVQKFNTVLLERIIPDEDPREKLKLKLSHAEKLADIHTREQLSTVLNDGRGGILQTINHYFADTLSAIRKERVLSRLRESGLDDSTIFDLDSVLSSVHLSNEDQAVKDIHDTLKAYYKVAVKRFADNVVLQVTERHILGAGGPASQDAVAGAGRGSRRPRLPQQGRPGGARRAHRQARAG